MVTPTVFTLEAVNSLVPRLRVLVEAQIERRVEIETRLERLAGLLGRIPESLDAASGDEAPVRELKSDIADRVDAYKSGWRAVEELGAVIKDPRVGLVDFYGRVDGKLVWLCWKYDEEKVMHYHGLDEGFSGRKPILATMRTRHLN
jgi:hypothetical protein